MGFSRLAAVITIQCLILRRNRCKAKRLLSRAGWEQVRKGAGTFAIWQRGRDRMVLSEHDPVSKAVMVKAEERDRANLWTVEGVAA